MIGYYTDNSVSKAVMRAFKRGGVEIDCIKNFDPIYGDDHIFYGILRGTGRAILQCKAMEHGGNFYYLDNGYFDAIYMDERKNKDMSGKYRVVNNALIDQIDIEPSKIATGRMKVLLMPPSPYTAFMHDTLPEEWTLEWGRKLQALGHEVHTRNKDDNRPFDKAVKEFDAVFAFNSIAVVKAIEMGKAVYTTHGIIPNSGMLEECAPYYDIEKIYEYFAPKQFTLEEIADRGVGCLS